MQMLTYVMDVFGLVCSLAEVPSITTVAGNLSPISHFSSEMTTRRKAMTTAGEKGQ